MSIFDRTSYFRALFVLLPFGITGLYFGISGLIEKESNLDKYEGIVSYVHSGYLYSKLTDGFTKAYQIRIEEIDEIFRTHITKHMEILEPSLSAGDRITLWTRDDSLGIVKLQRNEELLIPFNSTTCMDLLILLIGIVFTSLSIIYIIKHPEDLWGGDKEKMKRWWNGELW